MPFGLWTRVGPRKHVFDWAQIPMRRGIRGKDMPGDYLLPWAVQKWLKRSNWHLGCGLGWAEGSTRSIVFARLRQCALARAHWRNHLLWITVATICHMQVIKHYSVVSVESFLLLFYVCWQLSIMCWCAVMKLFTHYVCELLWSCYVSLLHNLCKQ